MDEGKHTRKTCLTSYYHDIYPDPLFLAKQQRTTKRSAIKIMERTDCAICDKNFDSSETLRRHIRTVHECDPDDIFGVEPQPSKRAKKGKHSEIDLDETLSDDEVSGEILTEEDLKLKANVGKLIDMLVDPPILKKYGWPNAPEEMVLCKVIENCGHDLTKGGENYAELDYGSRMREYCKLLFTVVIHNDSIKSLLNNFPIDDVIEYVLGDEEQEDGLGKDKDVEDKSTAGDEEPETITGDAEKEDVPAEAEKNTVSAETKEKSVTEEKKKSNPPETEKEKV